MQIYVVEPGDSLYSIGKKYGVSADEIAAANQIDPEKSLVVGQALVIPNHGTYYIVQQGDSLYTIGRKFGVNFAALAEFNDLDPSKPLQIGQQLTIPRMRKPSIETNAYVSAANGNFSRAALDAVREHAKNLTYIAPFSYEVQRDGSLSALDVPAVQNAASNSGAALMMVVTNIENGRFSDTLGEVILNDMQVQNRLLDEILQTAKSNGFQDVHFDFEYLRPADRENYNAFLRKAADLLHGEGLLMSTALAPKTSADQTGAWYTAHDYKTHGEIADFVVIMTYEWGYSGGPPMAVSPIGPVRQVLEYAKTEIPADKIFMGQNLYGYDWTLPYVKGGEYAKAISPQAAIDIARQNRAAIEYDKTAKAPFFHYWDNARREHVVWFEDARSIDAKFSLLKELGLRGISYWRLGFPFPQNWLLLSDRFDIIKQ